MTDPEVRLLQSLIFSNAVRVEFDRSGRILIPQYLRDGAGLQCCSDRRRPGQTLRDLGAGPVGRASHCSEFTGDGSAFQRAQSPDALRWTPTGNRRSSIALYFTMKLYTLISPKSPGRYIDATVGAGGHAWGILAASHPEGKLLGLDLDPQALALASEPPGGISRQV